MQGLQAIWNLPQEGFSWATAGYMGAIMSGQCTCGLLVGCATALGLRVGRNMEGIPEAHPEERKAAIKAVGTLYKDFIKEFGSTDCLALSGTDWSNPEDVKRYVENKVWKEKCDFFLDFVMKKCMEAFE